MHPRASIPSAAWDTQTFFLAAQRHPKHPIIGYSKKKKTHSLYGKLTYVESV